MKTPKREYKKYHICPATGEPDEWALGNIDARWKRKNRIAQLKHTIARQKKEYERLWESFSHMSKRCCELLYPTDQP